MSRINPVNSENPVIVSKVLSAGGSASQRRGARHRHERIAALRRGFEIRELFSVRLQVLEEPLKLLLHRVHLLAHVQNDLDTGKIHAQVARQRKNQFQSFEIRIGVEPRVSFRARRFQEPFTLVESERLRMNPILIRYRTDRVCSRLSAHSNPISTRGFVVFNFEYSRSKFFVSSEITFGNVTCTSTN